MKKAGKTKVGAGVAKVRAANAKATRNRQSAETKLAELKRRLLEINDLAAGRELCSAGTSSPICRGVEFPRGLASAQRLYSGRDRLLNEGGPHSGSVSWAK
jgi:hypothetical protein